MSSRQRFQLSHALPDGSWNTDGVACSANQVSLLSLSPSIWWPAPAAPQRKLAGNVRSVIRAANATGVPTGSNGWRYLVSDIGDERCDLGAEQLDAPEQVAVGETRVRHLEREPVDAAELLGDPADLVGDRLRVAHEERT